jgi:hypothetical protein
MRDWRERNRESYRAYLKEYCRRPEARAKDNEYHRRKTAAAKATVLAHYGNKCVCCGETEPMFLTIDHINGGGRRHRASMREANIHRWLVKANFPVAFQLLCYNCNSGRYRNGGVCPHVNTP